MLIRSLFFAPANRPDLVAKFPRIAADCFVIDLEDGTPPAEKLSARAHLPQMIDQLRAAADGLRIFVRINESESELHKGDLQAAVSCPIDGIVIPKIEDSDTARYAADALQDAKLPRAVVGGVESLKGGLKVGEICAAAEPAGLAAVYFGAEDFASALQARRTAAGTEVLYARSRVVMAARAFGVEPIDQAVVEVRDDARFLADAKLGRDLGFSGKICLLPRQVELAHEAFSPSALDVTRAERILSSYDTAMRRGLGTLEVDGQMIDEALLKRARQILTMAGNK